MGYGQRGRPRKAGERYPSGDIKPSARQNDTGRKEISGALWQRMFADGEKIFGDPRFGTELGRLYAIGQITSSEAATGLRIAGIYGRFEYYKNLRRSAASPHYIREYISEGAGADTELVNFRAREGRERDRSFNPDDREVREKEASVAFLALQKAIPSEYRAQVEALCVENINVGYQGLIRARIGIAIAKEFFSDQENGVARKDRKKRVAVRSALPAQAPSAKPSPINAFKDAFFAVRRKRSPNIIDADIEQEWNVLCALKSRQDFIREKSER